MIITILLLENCSKNSGVEGGGAGFEALHAYNSYTILTYYLSSVSCPPHSSRSRLDLPLPPYTNTLSNRLIHLLQGESKSNDKPEKGPLTLFYKNDSFLCVALLRAVIFVYHCNIF